MARETTRGFSEGRTETSSREERLSTSRSSVQSARDQVQPTFHFDPNKKDEAVAQQIAMDIFLNNPNSGDRKTFSGSDNRLFSSIERAVRRSMGLDDPGIMDRIIGTNSELVLNDKGDLDVRLSKTVNPSGLLISALAGPAGIIAQGLISAGVINDPLSFNLDLGLASQQKAPGAPGEQVTEQRDQPEQKQERQQIAQEGKAGVPFKSDIKNRADELLKQLLAQQQDFDFFAMPNFDLVSSTFAENLKLLDFDLLDFINQDQGNNQNA